MSEKAILVFVEKQQCDNLERKKHQKQPNNFLTGPGDRGAGGGGSVSDFLGKCLKNAFTAPFTPSSDSMALANSMARSFTCNFLGEKRGRKHPPRYQNLHITQHT